MNGENDDIPATRGLPKWAYTILAGVIVAGFGGSLASWRTIAVVDARVTYLETEQAKGRRYTGTNGDQDRQASIIRYQTATEARRAGDEQLSQDIQRIDRSLAECRRRLNSGLSREHGTIQAFKESQKSFSERLRQLEQQGSGRTK